MFIDLLSRGYFPAELPPPFKTISLGQAISTNVANLSHPFIHDYTKPYQSHCISRASRFSLARAGSLRRTLSMPNPVNYIQLAYVIDNHWNELQIHLQQSNLSLSSPLFSANSERAIKRQTSLGELPEIRAHTRTGRRYLLRTDINTFYSSIYTHSIPWSLHTKATSKSNRKYNQLYGNKIDTLVRNAQDQQTKGIPIGPDISLIIAEAILTNIDIQLTGVVGDHGFRYIDDYELSFSTYSEAESALSLLQELLTEYELQLNPNKTKIMDLPVRIEPDWVSELRRFDFRESSRSQKSDLIHYFDCAFDMWHENPDGSVLKYAISRSKSVVIDQDNWGLYESLILNGVLAEPGALPIAIDQFKRYLDDGYPLDMDKIMETFAKIVEFHAPHGHSSEVAWVLWGSLLLNLPIDNGIAAIIGNMTDSVVSLLALDAQSKGFIDPATIFNNWQNLMSGDELYDINWMVAYEAFEKSWLQPLNVVDYVAQDNSFNFFRNNHVSFYDDQASLTYTPPPISPVSYGSGGGGGISPDEDS